VKKNGKNFGSEYDHGVLRNKNAPMYGCTQMKKLNGV
jgi:hypothetical protein